MQRPSYLLFFGLAAVGIGLVAVLVTATSLRAPYGTVPIEEPVATPTPKHATLVAVGDIMLGRNVEKWMLQEGDDYPFRAITPFFQEHDLVLANLEGPIPKQHRPTPSGSTTFSFRKEAVLALAASGIDIVSLANNHTYDQGRDNVSHTRSVLIDAGIIPFGDQRSSDMMHIVSTTIHGRHIIFAGYNDVYGILDLPGAVRAIQNTRAMNTSSFIIAYIHWGDEYTLVGNKRQQHIAHQIVDAGVDVVIGHHPHVVQHIEEYDGKLIFYSLGNFIFDQYFSKDTQEGLGVTLTWTDTGVTYTLHPIDIVKSQPVLMAEPKRTPWLDALAKRSDPTLLDEIKKGTVSLP